MAKLKSKIGEVFTTNEGYKIKVIEYKGVKNCSIQFEDESIRHNVLFKHIKSGSVKNYNHKSIYNVACVGIGIHKIYINSKITKKYKVYVDMIRRVYGLDIFKKNPSYVGCLVSKQWLNFQNFGDWFDLNYKDGWVLDKDILIKGNKVYSPSTCSFVPAEINILFIKTNTKRGLFPIGVSKHEKKYVSQISKFNNKITLGVFDTPEEAFQKYKTEKEKHIREVAEKWKHLISAKVYEAMYNYKIEITD